MRILLTNDDGITAPGIAAMYRILSDLGPVEAVQVVAPMDVQSAVGHAVTIYEPIVTRKQTVVTEFGDQFQGIAVDGRPADCVKLAVNHLLDEPVDLVVSGMNGGVNMGINVLYSGTVAAAREAAIQGIPAIAVSLFIGDRKQTRWLDAAAHAGRVIEKLLDGPHQLGQLMNLNIPILDNGFEPKGVRVAPLSQSALTDRYNESADHAGDRCFKIQSSIAFRHTPADSDVACIFDGYITLTPLLTDSTDGQSIDSWTQHVESQFGEPETD